MSKKPLLHLPESPESLQEPFLKKRKKETKLVSFLKSKCQRKPSPLTRKVQNLSPQEPFLKKEKRNEVNAVS